MLLSKLCSLEFSVKVLFVSSLRRRKAFSADVSRAYGGPERFRVISLREDAGWEDLLQSKNTIWIHSESF